MNETAPPPRERLPARDWVLLPLLALMTLIVLFGATEVAARLLWPEQPKDACSTPDPVLGLRFTPNCRATMKVAESPWVENAYNGCGARTAEPCGARPRGGLRAAIIGTSIASGFLVPYEQTYAARATRLLSERCAMPVEFQNLAVPGVNLRTAPLHVPAALAVHPDAIILPFSVYDLEVLGQRQVETAPPPPPSGLKGLMTRAVMAVRSSRAAHMAQHFLYQDLDQYLPLYLSHGDEADFLRTPLSPAWRARLDLLHETVSAVTAQAGPAGVPVLVVFVPSRPQAALARWPRRDAGLDPTALGRALEKEVQRAGAQFLDLTADFAARPDAAALYYPVDGHPNAQGQAVIASGLVAGLAARGDLPAACARASTVSR